MKKKTKIQYSVFKGVMGLTPKELMKSRSDAYAALTHALHNGLSIESALEKGVDSDLDLRQESIEQREIDIDRLGNNSIKLADLRLPVEFDVPFPPPHNPLFRFIDLFAGIGGIRLALQSLGGKCVFSSEIDSWAKVTYEANFGEVPYGDITLIDAKSIPDHDILAAGFPCQAFSIAGKRLGFEEARGTLFFEIARIVNEKRPRIVFLENVKGLVNHRGGSTLRTILRIMREELGYFVPDPQIINAKFFGVPQNRERVFIVAFRDSADGSGFQYPLPMRSDTTIADILSKEPVPSKYYLSSQYLDSIKEHRRRHESKGNGFGYEIIPPSGIANAIVVGGMGRERNLVIDDRIFDRTPTTKIKGTINIENIRRMTPREWARLQGFPNSFVIPVSDAQAYKQFGNSVAVPAVLAVAKAALKSLLLRI